MYIRELYNFDSTIVFSQDSLVVYGMTNVATINEAIICRAQNNNDVVYLVNDVATLKLHQQVLFWIPRVPSWMI